MIPDTVDFEMRGGNNSDPQMNEVEKAIAEEAFRRVTTDPTWTELSFKTAYNFLHLNTFYGTPNPDLVRLINRVQPYPVYVEMEVTQKCPLRCVMCEHTYWNEPIDELPLSMFKHVMDQFPDLKWAGNNALGDPFTNPDYMSMVKYLDDKQVAQELYTTSFLLSPEQMEEFTKLKSFLLLKFSVDGATKETYEKIRVGIDFDKVMRNIKAVDRFKKKHGKFWPKVEFHYIIMKQNIHEAEMFLDLVDSLDIHCGNVMFSRLLHQFPEAKDIYCDVPQDLVEKLVKKGESLGIPVSVNGDARNKKPPANECTQWQMPYFFPDGTVIPCCCMNEQNRRQWQREHSMGNVFQKPFREIWNDTPYKTLRSNLWTKHIKEASPMCAMCNINDIKNLSGVCGC